MKNNFRPQSQIFWHSTISHVNPLQEPIEVDVAIVGGGMAGLSAAQAFAEHGKTVALLEQYQCGGGASGRSSGFVTPNAELSLADFIQRYGKEQAKNIWQFIIAGLKLIEQNIKKHNLACDYQPQDSLVLANSKHAIKQIAKEYDSLKELGFVTDFFSQNQLKAIISSDYYAGVLYPGSFGINGYRYCQEMKKVLHGAGVQIFEETPVLQVKPHELITPHGKVHAQHIIVCTDRFTPQLNLLKSDVYHAQTFVMASEPLTTHQISQLFPHKKYMAWDTDIIYNYFRVTGDNRLVVGGGTLLATYFDEWYNYRSIYEKLTHYVQKKFPYLDPTFEYQWPGLIGISKDISPLLGQDKNEPSIYYAVAATGLPVAAALGVYSAQHILDGRTDMDKSFSPYRSFPINGCLQTIIGKRLSFAISNFIKVNIP